MTNSTLTQTDPRSLFAGAIRLAGQTIAQVTPQQYGLPTPCHQMDVHHLMGHLLAVVKRVAHVGNGGSVIEVPEHIDGIADDGWSAAWTEAAHAVQVAFTDDAQLGRIFTLPWAQLPGAALLGMYANELTVHTWDLARATGQQPQFDDAVVGFAHGVMQHALPAEGRMASYEEAWAKMPGGRGDQEPPFLEAVPVPADVPMIDRLVAWNGRNPA